MPPLYDTLKEKKQQKIAKHHFNMKSKRSRNMCLLCTFNDGLCVDPEPESCGAVPDGPREDLCARGQRL